MNKNDNSIISNTEEDTLTLKDISKEIYPELAEITAYRKTIKNFEKACKQMGINHTQFKPGRDYKIPKGSKSMWILLLRNISVMEGNPSKKQYVNYIEDLTETKDYLDDTYTDLQEQEVDSQSYNDSMLFVYEEFYTSTEQQRISITKTLQNSLQEKIKRDFDYITNKAPNDRVVIYAEQYYKEALRKIEKTSSLFRKIITEEWYKE